MTPADSSPLLYEPGSDDRHDWIKNVHTWFSQFPSGLKFMDNLLPEPPQTQALPAPCHYVLSLYPVFRYLQQVLRPLGIDDLEFTASVLQGVALYVLNLNRDWVQIPPMDDLYARVAAGTKLPMTEAASLCREVDTQIGGIIFHHLPDLGRQDLLQLLSYEFVHNYDLRLVLQYRIPLLPAPVRDAGAGLPGRV